MLPIPMPLYFAYGANMDVAVMARRCPASRPLGVARLVRHRFFITRNGWSSVMRDARADVHGVLWNLAQGDVRSLDRFEEVERGLYVKALQPVFTASGPRRAMIYLATSVLPGRPVAGYMEGIAASAEAWGLPQAYRTMLATWLPGASGCQVMPAAAQDMGRGEMGPVPGVTPRALRPVSTV